MEIIQICPVCGIPAIGVNGKAVKYNIIESKRNLVDENKKWNVCNNPSCDCSYFSKHLTFKISDLIVPFFFKDNSDSVPICYCSNLSRGEIKNAVKNGCRSIDDVQNYTKKDITGAKSIGKMLSKCFPQNHK